jgi:hypothetical protein
MQILRYEWIPVINCWINNNSQDQLSRNPHSEVTGLGRISTIVAKDNEGKHTKVESKKNNITSLTTRRPQIFMDSSLKAQVSISTIILFPFTFHINQWFLAF